MEHTNIKIIVRYVFNYSLIPEYNQDFLRKTKTTKITREVYFPHGHYVKLLGFLRGT